MHVLTSIYQTLDSFVVINQRLFYFTDNYISTLIRDKSAGDCRILKCGQLYLHGRDIAKYIHKKYINDEDVINDLPENTRVLVRKCYCDEECIKKQILVVKVRVNKAITPFNITECETCRTNYCNIPYN